MILLKAIDSFPPDHSFVQNHVHIQVHSRYWILAASPALASLDIAYHSTALILKTLRAVVLIVLRPFKVTFQSKSLPSEHLAGIASAVRAGLSYPFAALTLSRENLTYLERRIYPKRELLIPGFLKIATCALAIICMIRFTSSLAQKSVAPFYQPNTANVSANAKENLLPLHIDTLSDQPPPNKCPVNEWRCPGQNPSPALLSPTPEVPSNAKENLPRSHLDTLGNQTYSTCLSDGTSLKISSPTTPL